MVLDHWTGINVSMYGRLGAFVVVLSVLITAACSGADTGAEADPGGDSDSTPTSGSPSTDDESPDPEPVRRCTDASGPRTGAWIGVSLDGAKTPLPEYADHLGQAPAVVVAFAELPLREVDVSNVTDVVESVAATGSAVLLTLEPMAGLGSVDDDAVQDLVSHLRTWNDAGAAVIVRYGHEMNGSWYAWGQQPRAYRKSFRTLARAIHAAAPGSQTMWAPSYSGGYPFEGGEYAAAAGSAAAAEMDTDGDGALGQTDHAYSPYYPGDEHVDWVGMSVYHWGNVYPWGENEIPYADKLIQQLTGTYVGPEVDESVVPDFYQEYAVRRGKPVAIAETAAMSARGRGGADELAVKRSWWRQVLAPDLLERLPQVKMVNWFEWHKFEPEVAAEVTWAVAEDPAIRRAFRADLPPWARFGKDGTC